MQKIKRKTRYAAIFVMIFMGLCFNTKEEIFAKPTGTGASTKPYQVSKFDDLNYALTTGARSSGKTYIQVSGTIHVKKNINVEGGSFVIYAGNGGAVIRKSTNASDDMNDPSNPRYCIRVGLSKETNIEIGCTGTGTVTLGGQKSYYETNHKISSGWMHIGRKATVKLGNYTVVQNMINNDTSSQLSNLSVYGELIVDCSIKNCKSVNGGAICAKESGIVELKSNTVISNCSSQTEGGAVWIKDNAYLKMEGAKITKCSAKEEGGAIFVSGNNARADILSGSITYNTSGYSAGGVFAGYGATLNVGAAGTDGPGIENNTAGGSGGGIRANGGLNENAGGNFHFYSGRVNYNKSGKYGGGISIGEPGKYGERIAYVCCAEMIGNYAEEDGGGICIPKNVDGDNGKIILEGNVIKNNYAKKNGGGIYGNTPVKMDGNYILANEAGQNGGGVYIGAECTAWDYSSHIGNNKAGMKGRAVYLAGNFHMGGVIDMYENNEIYICKGKYIENDKLFVGKNRIISKLDSSSVKNGTKLVYIGFTEGTGETVLYGDRSGEEDEYYEERKHKNFEHINLLEKQLLRSSGMVKNLDNRWIIISRKYTVEYVKNISENPTNMPSGQTKFYEEDVELSRSVPESESYEVVKEKMWNERSDGQGKVRELGEIYENNSDLRLYAIWKLKFIVDINAQDRYYVVGQDIVLSEKEILKKVAVTDNQNSNYLYKLLITKICDKKMKRIVFDHEEGIEKNELEKYLSTAAAGSYEISLYSENTKEKKTAEQIFSVYIIEDKKQPDTVRFISRDYLYTLNQQSIWKTGSYYKILRDSFNQEKGDSYLFNGKKVNEIKDFVKKFEYKMNWATIKIFYSNYLKRGV